MADRDALATLLAAAGVAAGVLAAVCGAPMLAWWCVLLGAAGGAAVAP